MTTLNISSVLPASEFKKALDMLKEFKAFHGYAVDYNNPLTSKEKKAYAIAAYWLAGNGWEIGFQFTYSPEDIVPVIETQCRKAGFELAAEEVAQVLNAVRATQAQINGTKLDTVKKGQWCTYGWY